MTRRATNSVAEDAEPLLADSSSSIARVSDELLAPTLSPFRPKRQVICLKVVLVSILAILCLVLLAVLYYGRGESATAAGAADQRWIATSPSAFDRFTCRWFGVCGFRNWWYYEEPSAFGRPEDLKGEAPGFSAAWVDYATPEHPAKSWDWEERAKREIPQYVIAYAPYVFLHEQERFWPSDPAEHLSHSVIRIGDQNDDAHLDISLSALGSLNDIQGSNQGRDAYLFSQDDPDMRPEWMLSRHNKPGADPEQPSDRSRAPAVLICVRKPGNVLDAFWFFFYSFNEGNTVLGTRYGNHIGDWEHTMVRFCGGHGPPEALYLSRHSWGSAYTYDAMEKIDSRPIVFAGNGSHAHYPTEGQQPYVLPFSMLKDVTGHGVRWDPALHLYAYTYEPPSDSNDTAPRESGVFRAATLNPRAPVSWLTFAGHWGDRIYPLGDPRQYRFFGEKHFATGPTGPRDKRIEREGVCDTPKCVVRDDIP